MECNETDMSNTQKGMFVASVVLILLVGAVLLSRDQDTGVSPPPSTSTSTPSLPATSTADMRNFIRVTTPVEDQLVRSPLLVQGEARGTWYFEASFPVKVFDANGIQLVAVPAQAQGEWMTEDFVPFKAEMRFATPTTETGTLVFENDNPSGLPEFSKEYRIPVRFDRSAPVTSTVEQRTIKLYYYNPKKDTDALGNILCSAKGLVEVERTIPRTVAVIRDAVEQLLKGELTAAERTQGITTEFPLPGVELTLASITNNVLTLTFNDPQNRTSGGSCRAAILWAQIEATAKQFGGVKTVKFLPENVFQP
jgi:hypothetical protein